MANRQNLPVKGLLAYLNKINLPTIKSISGMPEERKKIKIDLINAVQITLYQSRPPIRSILSVGLIHFYSMCYER
jgi:hypothetical protein